MIRTGDAIEAYIPSTSLPSSVSRTCLGMDGIAEQMNAAKTAGAHSTISFDIADFEKSKLMVVPRLLVAGQS